MCETGLWYGRERILSLHFNDGKLTIMVMGYTHFIIQSAHLHFQNGIENFVYFVWHFRLTLTVVIV